jgi:hypothetical protein
MCVYRLILSYVVFQYTYSKATCPNLPSYHYSLVVYTSIAYYTTYKEGSLGCTLVLFAFWSDLIEAIPSPPMKPDLYMYIIRPKQKRQTEIEMSDRNEKWQKRTLFTGSR